MDKKYISVVSLRTPRPRSERLRKLGGTGGTGSGSTVVNISGGGSSLEGHTHGNLSALDRIGADDDGYLYVDNLKPTEEEDGWTTVQEKVRAGYADEAGRAKDADHADDAEGWDGHLFDDYLDQPVRVDDDVEFQSVTAHDFRTPGFVSGMTGGHGASIDKDGNVEVEGLRVRSYMEIMELIYNRLNALEGNTSFADVGTIDSISEADGGVLLLTMRKRWDGDNTAFQPGDVVYGYVNDLSASGVYYKCWLRVTDVDTPNNTLKVVSYAGADVPAGVNYPPTEDMIITRWGNAIEPTAASHAAYPSVVRLEDGQYVNARRDAFYISCEDGNLVQLMGVYQPKTDSTNHGVVLGRIPKGLVDAALPINYNQPYLYARGIIVQDLIRINYEGVVIRTENYRGQWNAADATSDAGYYRSTDTMYDTVTHNGVMWQCAANGTSDEPSDATGSWVRMSGKETEVQLEMWLINPSTNIISVRKDVVTPSVVSCIVEKRSTGGNAAYTTTYELAQAGYQLFYSLDGEEMLEFIIGRNEPLEAETGEEIELESSVEGNVLCLSLGGDDIEAERIGDRVTFYLTDAETGNIVTKVSVPVVKDGIGDKGEQGRLIYPAGIFNDDTTYVCTAEKAPVVLYAGKYYVMVKPGSYQGSSAAYRTPADDAANNPDPSWSLMSDFAAVFAEILFANFAKLGSAVFYGDYLFSQNGTIRGSAADGVDAEGVAYYQQFTDGVTYGTFIPNLMLNLRTGELVANNATIKGTIDATSGKIGGFKIGNGYIGVDTDLDTASGGDGMALFPGFIKFANDDWSLLAMIGKNVLPASAGVPAVGRFENTRSEAWTNYGVILDVKNAWYNIALQASGNIVTDGLCDAYRIKNITLKEGSVTIEQFDCATYIVKCTTSNSSIALPTRNEVTSQLGISSSTPFSIRLTIIGDVATTVNFNIWGRNTTVHDSNNNYFLSGSQYPYRLNDEGAQQNGGLAMAAGDVAEFQLVWDGTNYYAYIISLKQ